MNPPNSDKLFQIGEHEFDIKTFGKPLDHVNNHVKLYLIKTIEVIENEKIVPFLEYNLSKTDYKLVFLQFVHDSVNNYRTSFQNEPQKSKKGSIYDWLAKHTPYKLAQIAMAFELFGEESRFYNDEIDRWGNKVGKFLNHKEINEVRAILQFSNKLIGEKYKFHLISCTNPFDCQTNQAYEAKLEIMNTYLMNIENKIEQMNPKPPVALSYNRIEWLGTQKQLGELFVELRNKGWIQDINYDALKSCFTKSKSIHQVLKPGTNTKLGMDEYDQIYTSNYSPKFYGISENPKAKK